MGERLNRRLAKWDASNQATMRKQNEWAGGTWEEFDERNFLVRAGHTRSLLYRGSDGLGCLSSLVRVGHATRLPPTSRHHSRTPETADRRTDPDRLAAP
jgi:hypothetical protein